MFRWGDEITVKFIRLYRDYECLWNPSNSSLYKNKIARENAYIKIQHKMNEYDMTVKDIKNKIKSLRSTYHQELKKIKISKSSGARTSDVYKPRLRWFEEMDFLNATFEYRNSTFTEPNQVLKKRKFNEDSSQPGTSSMTDCDVPSAVNISMSALVATWVEKLNVTNPQQMKFAKKFIHEILSLAAQGKLHENSIHIDEDENSIDSNTVYDTQADQSEDETLELDAMDDIIDIKEELIEYPMMTENDTETENLNKTLPIEYNNPECSTLSLEIKQERDHISDEDHTQTLNIDKHCKEKSDDIHMIDQSKDDFYYFGLSVGNKLRKINDLDEQQRYSCEKNILDALYNTLIEISSNRSNIEPTDIAKMHNIPKLVEVSA